MDIKKRVTKNGQPVEGYLERYIYMGIPASVLQYICQGVSDMVIGNVGITKHLKQDGYYWMTLNITSPEEFKYKGFSKMETSGLGKYQEAPSGLPLSMSIGSLRRMVAVSSWEPRVAALCKALEGPRRH